MSAARLALTLAVTLVSLALPGGVRAGGPTMLVGVDEDAVKAVAAAAAKRQMDLVKAAGFNAVRMTSIWAPGMTAPTADELRALRNATAAARLDGIRPVLALYQFGSATTPLDDTARAQFARWAASIATALPTVKDFVIGNEPNLNRFWLPQFNADGSDAAAPAYVALLASVYDALKAVSSDIRVIGGAVSPRGGDKPGTGRDTHSPTQFILDMGAAYRASGRTTPIMDAYAQHGYEDNSSLPPTASHPNTTTIAIADYTKLAALLGKAFDGTGQPGSTLPIWWAEFGVESRIPPAKAALYTGTEIAAVKPVDETTQGAYYAGALQLAFCQPTVQAVFLFHNVDESDLNRFQSGLYYADGTPKTSLPAVRAALLGARRGILAQCPGLQLTPQALVLKWPTSVAGVRQLGFVLGCDIDCTVTARVEKLATHGTTLSVRAFVQGGSVKPISFRRARLARGTYRFTLRLRAPVNAGPPADLVSAPFTVS